MSSECRLCHRPNPDVKVDLLRVKRLPPGQREGAYRWAHIPCEYCQSCFYRVERAQTVQSLVRALMVGLPMAWLMFGAALLYGFWYTDPATVSLEMHMLFAGSSLAGFIGIPYGLCRLVEQEWFQAWYTATPEPRVKPSTDERSADTLAAEPERSLTSV